MDSSNNTLYTPYGAYELKAKYQRNMIISNAIVTTFIAAIVAVSMLVSGEKAKAEPKGGKGLREISIKFEPISIRRPPPPTSRVQPPEKRDVVGSIPVPVPDEEYFEDDFEIETADSFYSVSGPFDNGIGFGDGSEGTFDGEGDMPGVNKFEDVDRLPEAIQLIKPKYPRLAIEAGLEGTAWIAAHVDIDGSVIEARVYKSSTLIILDDAALEAALKNTFRPAIKNNQPIKLWVSYKVEFVLDR